MVKRLLFVLIIFSVCGNAYGFMRTALTASANVVNYGLRFLLGYMLEAPLLRYVHQWEHAKTMNEASERTYRFIRREIDDLQLDVKEGFLTHIKVDREYDCLYFSSCLPGSKYTTCGTFLIIMKPEELEILLEKQEQNFLDEHDKRLLNRHRFFIRHQLQALYHIDSARFITFRIAVPIGVLTGSCVVRTMIHRWLDTMEINKSIDENIFTYGLKTIIGTSLTVMFEYFVALFVIKRFYQHRQHVLDGLVDFKHEHPEIMLEAIEYLQQLIDREQSRINLGEFFLSENTLDFKRRLKKLKMLYEQQYAQVT